MRSREMDGGGNGQTNECIRCDGWSDFASVAVPKKGSGPNTQQ